MPQESAAPATVYSEELWKSDCIVVVGRFRPWARSGFAPGTLSRNWAVWFGGRDGSGPRELGKVPVAGGFSFPCVQKDEDSCTVRTIQRKDGEQTPPSLFVGTEPKVAPPWARPVLQWGMTDAHQPYSWSSISWNTTGLLNTALPGLLLSLLRFMMDLTFRDLGLWGRGNLWVTADPLASPSPSKLTGPDSHLFNFLPPKELTI